MSGKFLSSWPVFSNDEVQAVGTFFFPIALIIGLVKRGVSLNVNLPIGVMPAMQLRLPMGQLL